MCERVSFCFKRKIYDQIDDVCMDSPLEQRMVNILMSYLEVYIRRTRNKKTGIDLLTISSQ